ncbi:hypothetical protein CDEF62S_02395 [Castellaniella defragrans]
MVHVIGLLTSMFTSVVGVRALANLWYGRKRKLKAISIGTVWHPNKQALNHDTSWNFSASTAPSRSCARRWR